MKLLLILLGGSICNAAFTQDLSQYSPSREKWVLLEKDTTVIDTLSIVPGTMEIVSVQGTTLQGYVLNELEALLIWETERPKDSVKLTYKVFPYMFFKSYSLKDRSLIRKNKKGEVFNPGDAYQPETIIEGYNSSGSINKSGYLSRGINVGNGQDLSVNSDLNLQLSGYLTDDLQLLASISDANIPIQPGGNSQTLQEFDQVYINVFNSKFSLTAGDYILRSKPSRYLTYFKRAQGAKITFNQESKNNVTHEIMSSAAVSKGKYARTIFTAIEGNQGPYRLTGAEGETFVILLAGTERVFIDGKLMKRGEEFDYVIDYNSAELTFTPNQPITKDKRIQVEFQYSDKNYARSILQASDHIKGEKFKAYVSAYAEQDAKNQELQQVLTPEQRGILSASGDNILEATVSAIDSTGFTPEGVHYELLDSLGYDSVFVFSSNPDLAIYTLRFSEVGEGNADYVQEGFSANGRFFRWVAPDTVNGVLVRNGSFAPFILLVSPKKQQVLAAGIETKITRFISIKTEGSITNNDINTFSSLNSADNTGYSGLVGVSLKKDSALFKKWSFQSALEGEVISKYFTTAERFRTVEFLRDWNLNDSELRAQQVFSSVQAAMNSASNGSILLRYKSLSVGNMYSGNNSGAALDIKTKNIKWKSDVSYLRTSGDLESNFYRHKNTLSYALKKFSLGYEDEYESNLRRDSVKTGYQFFDYQFFIISPDSSRNKGKVFYRKRTDYVSTSLGILQAADATQIGASYAWVTNKTQSLKLNVSQRILEIKNDSLINQEPENNVLGRLEYRLRVFKNALSTDFFYQVGSGLEQRREYIYLEVPAGQGVYIWNDYNGDNVRDLSEFELAAFGYEANFIRTFIPSNEYQQVFSNAFNMNASITPSFVWNNQKGARKWASKFSHQFSLSADRKTTDGTNEERYNPLLTNINQNSLQALNSSVRNTLFYNKLSTTFGADFTSQINGSKILLSNGLESRSVALQRINLRWNYSKTIVVRLALADETSSSEATNVSGRNFQINSRKVNPEVTFQPNNKWKVSAVSEFSDKINQVEGAEDTAELFTLGLKGRYNEPGKASIEAEANVINVDYNGPENSALAFEMLEGLNTGTNFTWTVSIQQNLNKNIQVSVGYFGRKSETNPFIHSGSVQVRALF